MKSRRRLLALSACGLLAVAGCNAALGLSDYVVRGEDSGTDSSVPDVASDTAAVDTGTSDGPSVETGCDGSIGKAPTDCYGCSPQTNEQYLNACSSSSCVPFDDTKRLLNWDGGGLPPVPDLPEGGAG
jgi:hypothetical protein